MRDIIDDVGAMTAGVPHRIANLANTAAYLFEHLPAVNWAGFYLLENGLLVLGPFGGKPACVEIEIGKGVCGTAVRENRTIAVPDVHAFSGHIACDSASNSEIVVPLRKNGRIIGVLDVDSPEFGRFTDQDIPDFEALGKVIEEFL